MPSSLIRYSNRRSDKVKRCDWAGITSELYIRYHDEEWGRPVHDDCELFEFLILEGQQAGLSWSTILNKRENFRKAFANFDPKKVATFTDKHAEELKQNEGIIRNSLKIKSAINNAKQFLKVQEEFGSFDKYIWGFVDNKTIDNKIKSMSEIPTSTDLSKKISKDLKKRKFNFIGPTIIYAFMQAVGMVNDHLIDCFCYKEINSLK